MKNLFNLFNFLFTVLYAIGLQIRHSASSSGAPLMALIKMAHIVAEARGSIAGTVFSRNTYGAYLRQKVTPINKQSIPQQVVRQFLAQLASGWRALTAAERATWNQGAVNFTRTNIFGDNVQLTGFNLYMRLNKNLLTIGEAVIDVAPTPGSVPGFNSLSITANTTGGALTVAFAAAIDSNVKVIVKATAPLSQGKDFAKSQLRKMDTLSDSVTTPWDAATSYTNLFGALPPVGTKIFIEFTPVNLTTGQAGVPIKASAIAV